MKNNTKNIRKGVTAILFAVMMIVSAFAVVPMVKAGEETTWTEISYDDNDPEAGIGASAGCGFAVNFISPYSFNKLSQIKFHGCKVETIQWQVLEWTGSGPGSLIAEGETTVTSQSVWTTVNLIDVSVPEEFAVCVSSAGGPGISGDKSQPIDGRSWSVISSGGWYRYRVDTDFMIRAVVYEEIVDITPPDITCPTDITLEQESAAGTVVPLTATATDICDADVEITSDAPAIFPLGTTTVTFTATDDTGNSASCTTTVTVEDTTPPEITASGEQIVLWPPNHKYRTVEIFDCVISVTDICDADVDIDDIEITSVSSDEPEDAQGKGDGNTVDDIVIVDSQTVELRAERQGGGNGRVYTINFEVTDDSGNTATGSCTVWVPHDQSGDTAVDDGPGAGYTVWP